MKINILKEAAFSFRAREKRRADVRKFDRIAVALAVVTATAGVIVWNKPFTLAPGEATGFAYFILVLFAYLPMEVAAVLLRAAGGSWPAWITAHPGVCMAFIDLLELVIGWLWVHTRSVHRNGGSVVKTATHVTLILLVWGCCHLACAAFCNTAVKSTAAVRSGK